MRVGKLKAAGRKADSKSGTADPRLVALVRLLARDAARQDCERELSGSQDEEYPCAPLPKDAP